MKSISDVRASILESISEALISLYSYSRYKTSFNPIIIIISFMSMSVVTSLSIGIIAPLASLAFLTAIAAYSDADLKILFKVISISLVLVLIIYIPMYIYRSYFTDLSYSLGTLLLDNYTGILPLILRISSSIGFIILILHLLGVRGLGISLRQMGVPSKWVDTLILTIIFIPVMSRELIKIMLGRESRIVVDHPRLRRVWRLLSTVVGEVIIKGHFRAYRLQLTLKARLINEEAPRAEERDIKNGDIALFISSLVMIFLIIIFSAV